MEMRHWDYIFSIWQNLSDKPKLMSNNHVETLTSKVLTQQYKLVVFLIHIDSDWVMHSLPFKNLK